MRAYVVDAFTDAPFAGNPAGVCLPDADHAADADWMQAVATELRHSETAFLAPSARPDADWDLRWFTPSVEVDLCGHATLASAHVLFTEGLAEREVRFWTRSGVLVATRHPDGAIGLDFPVWNPEPVEVPEGLADALGVPLLAAVVGSTDLIVEVATADEVRKLTPALGALAAFPYRLIAVTAPGDTPGIDFVSRVFAPAAGIDEDPVTGSVHCALGPYWAPRVGRTALTGFQASERGGAVGVELRGDRVLLLGLAVTVLKGELAG
ncbi:PhzF family phenazine biosynthesis protein [Yinghuangia seranimata]|uniref:PhzF family phenazine biosynthesis protein n=1 Tax=Yinghuangia seranimata TaxID=408067 RepID=UPI00248B8E57|nr:PhzF family phenazine biosynthesis isomerase [Yinghuangia seranimata]MDI2129737.1 PhzF family phenazine biosynthesis isomerase [Yinghuangia seranimata]